MNTPRMTPQQQKMLLGVAIAGLLLFLGFSLAPDLELAAGDAVADGEIESLLDDLEADGIERAPKSQSLDAVRAYRRAAIRAASASSTRTQDSPAEEQMPRTLASDRQSKPIEIGHEVKTEQEIPPPYQQRLALLAEEQAALEQHRQRSVLPATTSSATPLPTVARASGLHVEGADLGVSRAVGESPDTASLRRVDLVSEEGRADRGPTRGAWLSGRIELE